jgi:hypothetical protein
MKFEQLEFLKKKMEAVAPGISGRSYYTYDKGQKEKELMDRVGNVQDMLRSMASVADCFLGMLMDDMKVKDNLELQKPIEFPVQEVNQNDVFILDNKGCLKQILRPVESKDIEASILPYCISELQKLNKKLMEYTPSNPELAGLTIEKIVCKLSIEMQIQNNVLMTAFRHLMGKTDE